MSTSIGSPTPKLRQLSNGSATPCWREGRVRNTYQPDRVERPLTAIRHHLKSRCNGELRHVNPDAGAAVDFIGPLSYDAAKDVTAAMFGFPHWKALHDSLRTSVPSESDEVVSNEAELAARRHWQASELKQLFPIRQVLPPRVVAQAYKQSLVEGITGQLIPVKKS